MKKILASCGLVVALGCVLAGCGQSKAAEPAASSTTSHAVQSTSSSRSSSAPVSSSARAATSSQVGQPVGQYSASEYALMAFLKLDGQGVDHLVQNSAGMHWQQQGNIYVIDFGAHSTMMIVSDQNVVVKYDAPKPNLGGMGNKNAMKTYSKVELAREFGGDQAKIDQVLAKGGAEQGSQAQTTN